MATIGTDYLYPIRSVAVAAAGTYTVDNFASVLRMMSTSGGNVTFPNGAIINLAPNVPEYIRARPGEVITFAAATNVTTMA